MFSEVSSNKRNFTLCLINNFIFYETLHSLSRLGQKNIVRFIKILLHGVLAEGFQQ